MATTTRPPVTGYFVTGATGGLGRNLCQRLAAEGETCAGMGRDPAALDWLAGQGVAVHRLDVADAPALARAMAGAEVVFHCAALSAPWGPEAAFHAANVAGTANVLAAARQAGVRRVVVVSSPSVGFAFRACRDVREDDPLPARPVNAYAASKRAAERLVLEAAAAGQDCVILRPRGLFGPWDRALAPRLARVARRGVVPLPGGGGARVDVTCTANAVDALLAAAVAGPQAAGRIYNISNGAPVAVADLLGRALAALGLRARLLPLPVGPSLAAARLLEGVARLTGGWEPPVTAYALGVLAFDHTLDIAAARRDLGWQPRQSLDDGMAALAAWWRDRHGNP